MISIFQELLKMNENTGKGKQENQSAKLQLRAAQAKEEEEERIQTVAANQAARTALGHDGKYLKWSHQNVSKAKSAVNLRLNSTKKIDHKLLRMQDKPFLSIRNITSKVRSLSFATLKN